MKGASYGTLPPSKERSSNLELMRIVLMLLIIMHHYVVNSGVMSGITIGKLTTNTVFLQIWGMWGKTAINPFILISGYFLCKSQLTWLKYLKLLFEVEFYNLLCLLLLAVVGYTTITVNNIYTALVSIFRYAGNGFFASFMAFYIFVPFLNIMISHIDKRRIKHLLALLIFYQVITVTIFYSRAFNEISWYMTLYLTGAYLRLYAGKWTKNLRFVSWGIVLLVGLSYLSVLGLDAKYQWRSMLSLPWSDAYYWISDSSKILAFLTEMFIFLFFLNMPMKHHPWINKVAKTTFGVLLIHANSDIMRHFLWHDVFQVYAVPSFPLSVLLEHAFGTAVLVFAVCSLMDYIRLVFIERPVLLCLSGHMPWLNQPMFLSSKR